MGVALLTHGSAHQPGTWFPKLALSPYIAAIADNRGHAGQQCTSRPYAEALQCAAGRSDEDSDKLQPEMLSSYP